MAFEKRPTQPVELVSIFDTAFILGFPEAIREKYVDTLDIRVLGNLEQMENKPTVFKCAPLKVKFEHMVYTDYPDAWGIFSNHVQDVRYCGDISFSWSHGVIDDDGRGLLAPRVVQDIANQISAIANKSGENFFFTPPVGALHYARRVQEKNAALQMSRAI